MRRAGLRPLSPTDHVPSPAALARSAKLSRYMEHPVLLEIVGQQK
jgi:hypothetical protein